MQSHDPDNNMAGEANWKYEEKKKKWKKDSWGYKEICVYTYKQKTDAHISKLSAKLNYDYKI